MRTSLGLWIVFILGVGCNRSAVHLGTTQTCDEAGGQCLLFPSGCPAGQWDKSASCSDGNTCCVGSSGAQDLATHQCAPTGASCARNADCCSSDCPIVAGGNSTCGGGGDMSTLGNASCSVGTCVTSDIDCPRGHIGPACSSPNGSGPPAARCCVPGTQAVPCGVSTCGVNQVCVEPCYAGVACVPKVGGTCPQGTAETATPCLDGSNNPGCTPSGQFVCVDLPTSCDVSSQASACGCFAANPCSVGTCSGNVGPGQVACFCS